MSVDLSRLNPPQRAAAECVAGPLVLFAGAGSGKTLAVVHRAAVLLDRGVPPHRLLLVTFTNKAADELRERLVTLVGAMARRVWAGTFHAVCVRILRKYAGAVDRRRDFAIYDDEDQETVIKQIVGELNLDKKVFPVKLLAERIQRAKQEPYTPDELREAKGAAPGEELETFLRVWSRYELWLRSCNAVDFEDLIVMTMRLAESETDIGRDIRSMFAHVMVDEFQDTSTTQYRLVRALTRDTRNLAVVGDDDQCLYTWRSAKVEYIRHFTREFPDATVVRLEQNYRSTKNIVGAALGIISQSKDRVPKELWTANEQGTPVEVYGAPDQRMEGRYVMTRIQRLVSESAKLSDMAVLYRMHAQSRAIEDALRDAQVRYRVIGGLRFYDRREVKDVVSYLRLLTNPHSDVDLMRVINVPSRGLGPTTVRRIGEIAASKNTSLWHALPVAEVAGEIGRRERQQIAAFRETIAGFMDAVESDRPSELARRLVDGIGYRKLWVDAADEAEKEGRTAEARENLDRASNVEEVVNAIAAYEDRTSAEGDFPTMRGYIEVVTLATSADERAGDAVSLMTIHAAKGLEWPFVWCVGWEDGRFPSGVQPRDRYEPEPPPRHYSVDEVAAFTRPMSTHDLLAERVARIMRKLDRNGQDDYAENLRLAYVAVTRARTHLWITYAESRLVYGKVECNPPSRFIDFIPKEVRRQDGVVANARLPMGGTTRYTVRRGG